VFPKYVPKIQEERIYAQMLVQFDNLLI